MKVTSAMQRSARVLAFGKSTLTIVFGAQSLPWPSRQPVTVTRTSRPRPQRRFASYSARWFENA